MNKNKKILDYTKVFLGESFLGVTMILSHDN